MLKYTFYKTRLNSVTALKTQITTISKINVIILFAIILGSYSCRKKEVDVWRVSQDIKDFTVFKPGTWWLYKNLKTNLEDTWKVLELNQGISGIREEPSKFEFIETKISSYTLGKFDLVIKPYGAELSGQSLFDYVDVCFFENSSKVGNNICNDHTVRLIHTDSLAGICVTKEFDLYPNTCSGKYPKFYKWKRNIGLVEMAFENSDTLVLQAYNILQ